MEPATDVGTVEDSVTAEGGRFNRGELLAGAGAAAAALGLGLPGLAQAKQLHALAADAGVKNLRWALSGAPSSFDVAANFSGDTMVAMYLTQDTLVSYDAKLNLVPVIASILYRFVELLTLKSWSTSASPRTVSRSSGLSSPSSAFRTSSTAS